MGFSSLIDILGSIIVGGTILLILFRLNDATVENSYNFNGEVIAHQNLVEVVSLLEHDLRMLGYCADFTQLPDPTQAIIYASEDSLKFLTDFSNPDLDPPIGDGILDTLLYYVGSPNELTNTPNPDDRILYRVENHQSPIGVNLGVTNFRLHYFDSFGVPLSFPTNAFGQITTIQIDLTVQNVYGMASKYDTTNTSQYYSIYWRQIRLASKNLTRR